MLNTSTTRRVVLILTFFIALATTALGQKTIAVSTANNWTFYTDFSTALNECASGSTIYLPGGLFILSQNIDTIDKQISIIGVGHYPDSTEAIGKTVLQGTICFTSNASSSVLVGFEAYGGLNALNTSPSNPILNLQISRCRFRNNCVLDYCQNCDIKESIFDGIIDFSNGTSFSNNCSITNSLLYRLRYMQGGAIRNCLITSAGCSGCNYGAIDYCNYVAFYNNIFTNLNGSYYFYGGNNNYGSNNLFFSSSYNPSYLTNTLLNGTNANTFVNVSSFTFSYLYDYRLIPSSIGHYGGTDGTDLGIYGTMYPYKPSAIPANPHISTKSISPSSAPNGVLPVNIRVIAQDR